ncbi:unnamed protein product [Sphagnum compactum]
MTITPESLAQPPSLSKEKRDHDNALLCALEASQLAGKIIDGVLSLHSPPHPFGGVASGLRRVAARLEVIGTDNVPDMREYTKELLLRELSPHLELRASLSAEFGKDLRSRSDAQLAQEIINGEIERIIGKAPKRQDFTQLVGSSFTYDPPAYIKFQREEYNDILKEICEAEIEIGHSGHVICPKTIEGRRFVIDDAAIAHIKTGKPLLENIIECRDLRRFLTVQKVTGGAAKAGKYLGKTIRFYYAKDVLGSIVYCKSGNKVPMSDGGKPCMILPTSFPDDIDYARYHEIAIGILEDIGYLKKRGAQLTML